VSTTATRPRTLAKRKARELAKYLRGERPDYAYLKDVAASGRPPGRGRSPAPPSACTAAAATARPAPSAGRPAAPADHHPGAGGGGRCPLSGWGWRARTTASVRTGRVGTACRLVGPETVTTMSQQTILLSH
jgi:hypothetical protein